MVAQRFLIPAAVLLPMACSSGVGEDGASLPVHTRHDAGDLGDDGGAAGAGSTRDASDDALIVPESLSVRALAGGNGVLDVIALTLRTGPSGTELYAALRNDGDSPACDAALSVELFDQAEQSVAAGIGGLLTQRFYRLPDGSGTVAACVGPGDVTMAAVMDLPADLAIDDVGYVVYRCPYFALDVVPIAGLAIRDVTSVPGRDGTAYAGTLVNELDVAVSNPSVTVFAVNRVGRPVGTAVGSGTGEIPPGGSWAFQTNTVDASGTGYVAYPAGALRAKPSAGSSPPSS